MDGIA